MDAVFFALFLGTVAFVIFHFLVSIPKGRFKRKWLKGNWPLHDHRPYFLPKMMHALHLTSMIALGFSGMYIRFPFFDGGRTAMRWVHYVAMVVVIVTFFWRLWYAFFSRKRDYRKFAIGRRDVQSLPGVLAYYSYIKETKPHVDEYNVMQKGTYQFFVILMFAQTLTGLSLITDPILWGLSPREVLVGWWLGPLVGDVAIAGAWMRVAHYAINWIFIILTIVHAYLSLNEDFHIFLDFFGIRRYPDEFMARAKAEAHGHGHAPAVAAAPLAGHEAE